MRKWCVVAVVLFAAFQAMAQPARGGARLATVRSSVDGVEQEYVVYAPRNFDPARKYPVIVALHEEDSNHIAELKHVFALPQRYGESALQNLMTMPTLPDADFIIVCPFARGNMAYQ